jgi:hypothetical protein
MPLAFALWSHAQRAKARDSGQGYNILELELIKCMLSHPAFIFKIRL